MGIIKYRNKNTELITEKQFLNGIKSLKTLYTSILPRDLAFADILQAPKQCEEDNVSNQKQEDMLPELSALFKKHMFTEEARMLPRKREEEQL